MSGITPAPANNSPCRHAGNVAAKMIERSRFGLAKYGQTVETNPLNLIEWLTHLQEELMDAVVYLERIKEEMEGRK